MKPKSKQVFGNMIRYIYSFDDQANNIKIELNNRIRKNNKYELVEFFGQSIKAMDKPSIFANKLVAIMDRDNFASRDLRDIYFFFEHHFAINSDLISERTGKTTKEYIYELHDFVSWLSTNHIIDANLGIVLNHKQKDRAKTKLKNWVLGYLNILLFELDK